MYRAEIRIQTKVIDPPHTHAARADSEEGLLSLLASV